MRILFRAPHTIFLIVVRLGLLSAIIILIPIIILSSCGTGGSGLFLPGFQLPSGNSDLSLEMAVSSGPYYVGGKITFTLTVANHMQDNASAVVLTDTLSPGMAVVSMTSTAGSCSGINQVICNLHTIQANQPETVTIVASANTSGQVTNSAIVSTADADPDLTNNSASFSFQVLPSVDISASLTASPDPAPRDGQITYHATVTNQGITPVTGVTLSDSLPPQVSLVSTSPQGACTGRFDISCSLGTLAPNASSQVTITVTADFPGTIANSVTASAAEVDLVSGNNTAQVNTIVKPEASLRLALNASTNSVYVGEQVTYQATVANTSPDLASNVVLTDVLPSQVSLVSIDPGGICRGTTTLSCDLGNLAFGRSARLLFTVVAKTDGLAMNSASIASQEVDANPADNSAQASLTIYPSADLSADLRADPGPAVAGQALTYTVQIANHGPSPVVSAALTDTLPAGATLVNALPSQGSCQGAGVVSCSLGKMAANTNASLVLHVNVPPDAQGAFESFAVVSASERDPIPANNTGQISTPVNTQADLAVTLTELPGPVVAGSELTYQMAVANNGPSVARQVSVVNTLPAGVSVKSSIPGAPACSASGNTLTCTQESLAPGAGFQVTFDVSASGSMTSETSVTAATGDPVPTNNRASTSTTVNPAPLQDSTPPTIEWINPLESGQNGASYPVSSDTLTLAVNASDSSGIAQVNFLRWEADKKTFVAIGTMAAGPYSVSIPTSGLNTGLNQIFAVAYDAFGNRSASWIWVLKMERIFLPMVNR